MQTLLSQIKQLPDELQALQETILSTQKRSLHIALELAQKEDYKASKVGGKPYLPLDYAYPLDKQGEPMEFLAQINFDEIEEGLEGYPTTGILQFFISLEDWGLDFDDPLKSDIKVIYHEQLTDAMQTIFPLLDELRAGGDSPIGKESYNMHFSPKVEVLPFTDFRYYKIEGKHYLPYIPFASLNKAKAEELEEAYIDTFDSSGHKLGGYAYFTQTDPRVYDHQEYTELLLQIDSDDSADILWGDAGVANFFIRKEDLEKRDFSQILYSWDCH